MAKHVIVALVCSLAEHVGRGKELSQIFALKYFSLTSQSGWLGWQL